MNLSTPIRSIRSRTAATLVAVALLATACSSASAVVNDVESGISATIESVTGDAGSSGSDTADTVASDDVTAVAIAGNQESHFDADQLEYDKAEVVAISLDGATATAESDNVSIDGSSVTITAGGVYALSGTLTDGAVVVEAGDSDVLLILDDIDINNADGSALAIMSADEASVLLADGSTNALSDGTSYTFPDADTDEPNAALYSAADLTIAGSGVLNVIGNYNDGVASKDGLVIASGTLLVEAVDDGIRGKDYVIVHDATIDVVASGDGIKADNEDDADRGYVQIESGDITLVAGDDGIQAVTDLLVAGGTISIDAADDGMKADVGVTIADGSITISDSYEGIESEVITVNGGFIDVTSKDDGLNVTTSDDATETAVDASAPAVAAPGQRQGRQERGAGGAGQEQVGDNYIYINGGTILITVLGELDEQGDGIDANGHIEMTGGLVVVSGPTDTRNSAIDYSGGSFVLTGGTFIGTNVDGRNSEGIGAGSTQPSLYITTGSVVPAETVLHIESADGESLVTFAPLNDYSVIVFTSEALVDGESYNVYLGGDVAGESDTSLYADSNYTTGDFVGTVVASTSL